MKTAQSLWAESARTTDWVLSDDALDLADRELRRHEPRYGPCVTFTLAVGSGIALWALVLLGLGRLFGLWQ